MDKRDLPKVLIVDVNAWREDAAAHTLLDIFRCWDPDKLALVYTSSELPYNEHCHKYFQIGESQIIRCRCECGGRCGAGEPSAGGAAV